jgi:hypothetical protein
MVIDMKNALAARIKKALENRIGPEADDTIAAAEAMNELELAARILEHGTYLGGCPYCGQGEFYLMKDTEKVINISAPGKDGCCCRDLVEQV